MREFPFDDIDDGKMRIEIDDRDTNTFIKKTLQPSDWKEVLMEVVSMLNGCGYVIDPRKAEKAFDELSASHIEEYLNYE